MNRAKIAHGQAVFIEGGEKREIIDASKTPNFLGPVYSTSQRGHFYLPLSVAVRILCT